MRRFYADLDNAIEAAHELFTKLEEKQPVYVFKTIYGTFKHKVEYSIRLMSEGVRPDSLAIVKTITKTP